MLTANEMTPCDPNAVSRGITVCCASAVPDIARAISEIDRSVAFDVASFDTRAAIELADATRKAIATGDKRTGVNADWQKVKIDRQIAALAKSRGAEVIYTDDSSQASFAKGIICQSAIAR